MRNLFSRPVDHLDVTRRHLDDRTADALLSGRVVAGEPQLTTFVAAARSLTAATPAPSPALAAMLEHGVATAAVTTAPVTTVLPRPASRRPLRVAAVTCGVLGLFLGAGAANALPGPVQNGVSTVVGWVSPLDLPRSEHVPNPKPTPGTVRTSVPDAQPGEDRSAQEHGTGGRVEPRDDGEGTRGADGHPGDSGERQGSDESGRTAAGSGGSGGGSEGGTTGEHGDSTTRDNGSGTGGSGGPGSPESSTGSGSDEPGAGSGG